MSTLQDIQEMYRLVSDGGNRKIQERGSSYSVTLPPGPLLDAGLSCEDEVLVVPSEEEHKLFEIYQVPQNVDV